MDNPAFVSEKDDKNKNYDITNVNVVNVTNNRGLNNQAKAVESNEWGPDWERYSNQDKLIFVLTSMLKSILAILCLYLFLLSLNFMSIGFTMISSYAIQAGGVIGFLLSNPFASLAVGIIVTATMQNATATTSIAIILVGAGIIPSVKSSVPIIMV
jgi:sodium-dependent phosphate cotransporter